VLMNKPMNKPTTKTTKTRSVPAAACCMNIGELELGDNGENAKSSPIRMTARSGKPINHWFWGSIVHDLSGMKLHKERLPIDYNHDASEVVGYLNHFETVEGNLVASGALTPFQEKDRATEIMFKAKAGVPYEASIFFGDPVMEEIDEGQLAQVNGYEFVGPGVIVRQWNLRGVAICPYGADMNTASQLADGKEIPVHFLNRRDMETNNTNAEGAIAPVEAEETESAEVQETVEAVEPVKSEPITVAPGKAFMDAFGEANGALYFAKGMSMEDAMAAHMRRLSDENAQLRASLAQRAERGMPAPIEFRAEPEKETPKLIRIAGRK